MKDKLTIARVNGLHPVVVPRFAAFIDRCELELDITLRAVQATRTFPEQLKIYQQVPKVTNAKPGQSYHNYGLAIDLVQLKDGQANWHFNYGLLQKFAQMFGLIWGADWDNDGQTKADGDHDEHLVDMPHYEFTGGYAWRTLLNLYNVKAFIPGTTFLRLPNLQPLKVT